MKIIQDMQSYIRNGLVVFLLLLMAASCDDEKGIAAAGKGEAIVTFAIHIPGAGSPGTRSLTESQESEVREIDILVFEPGGGTYVYAARCNASHITTDEYDDRIKTFSLKLLEGDFDLVIFANARDIIMASSFTGLSKATALAKLEAELPAGDKWAAGTFAPFPMWGDIGDITIDETTDLTGNKVKLTRAVARVDVSITGAAATSFQLVHVDVYNYNTRGTLVADMNEWDITDPANPVATAPNVPGSSVLTGGLSVIPEMKLIPPSIIVSGRFISLKRKTTVTRRIMQVKTFWTVPAWLSAGYGMKTLTGFLTNR